MSTAMFIDTKKSVLLQTAIAWVSRVDVPEQRVQARLIFDTGSQRSYISSRLRESLKLPTVKKETLMIKTFGSETGELQSRDQVQLCVYGAHAGADTQVSAYSVPVICSPLQNQAIQFASANYPHLCGLKLADSKPEEELQVDILVGADFYWHFISGGVRRGENGPTALETKLGWLLSGPVDHEDNNASTQANFTNTHALRVGSDARNGTMDADLDRQLSQFWELESIGIIQDEESVYDKFKNDIEFKEGRYQVKLPWKDPHIALPDNYGLSRGRLTSLTRRLKVEQLMEEYDAVIRDQLDKGIIERVNRSHPTVSHTHYLPHHPIIRRDKETTKMRVVYDASARTKGHSSLNDCLYSGPCLLPSIVDVLVRFRLNKVALVADIEKAFLMVSVAPCDRDALRFLWYDDVTQVNPQEVVYRFCRVVFGVTSSPFLLNATVSHHLSRYAPEDPELVRRLLDSLYVDDLNGGEANVETAFDTFVRSKQMFAEGGFNLRKWSTNSPELRQRIKNAEDKTDVRVPQPDSTTTQGIMEEDATYTKSTLGNDKTAGENGHQKVLGQIWNFQEDSLIFRLDHLAELARELPATKRSILKIVAKIFDPLGVLSPIVIEMKVLFQELCSMKAAWDDPLPEQLHRRWSAWCSDLAQTASLQIPRYYWHQVTGDSMTYQLHGFCDSSQTGYAAVVYIRAETQSGVWSEFLASKTRVTPLKKQSIPRLELLSALILSRLVTTLKSALEPLVQIDRVKCWTDSLATLYWIRGINKEWKTFVQNRVKEIRRLVPPVNWSHCPGIENPADMPSRGIRASKLVNDNTWFHGPKWLKMDEQNWPLTKQPTEPTTECYDEIKCGGQKNARNSTTTALVAEAPCLPSILKCENYSSFGRLLRVTGYLLRFVNSAQKKSRVIGALTAAELEASETLWIKEAQRQMMLKQEEKQLGAYTDDQGVVRCKGRLGNADIPFNARFPILLPQGHYLTLLIIRHCHEKVMHNGQKETLTEVRSKFWIVKGRQAVRRELHKCTTCRRFQGSSYPTPKSPNLPEFRVQEGQAFSSVGVDFAGPIYVKTYSKGPSEMTKTYIALFTCATSHAVHLELVSNLDAETFMRCFRRYTSRRGLPRLMVSDNAKTFQSAAKNLVGLFDLQEVQEYLSNNGIEWRFNLAKAPWWGRFFERLVKGVKSSLKKVLGRSKATFGELHTILTEVEAVLNSRPLTYQYSDSIEEPLMPSHLILGRRLLTPHVKISDDEEEFGNNDAVTR